MTTSSRALDVDVAQVLAIPPLDLRPNDRNQRHEDADIADLVASIPVIGILQPLIVLPTDADGLYTVVAGHRRRAAAIELGLPTVPCIVASDMDAATQILSMLAENQHRTGLTVKEEAQHYEQLTLLDWEPARIAKALGHSTEHVAGALAINRLPDPVAQAADAGQLDLANAAALTEFAEDPKAIDTILKRAQSWGFDHAIAEERRKRDKKKAAEVLKAELTLADVTVTSRPKDLGFGDMQRADQLLSADGDPIDPDEAANLPGFRVYIDDTGFEPRAVAYCPNPDDWGYTRRTGSSNQDRAIVAVWIAGRDLGLRQAAEATWGVDRDAAISYLDWLTGQGYVLSEAEASLRDEFTELLDDEDAEEDGEQEDDEDESDVPDSGEAVDSDGDLTE